MLAHHTRNAFFHKALLDTYVAKCRSEVSPTVGTATDLFYIGPTGFQPIEPELHKALGGIRHRLDQEIATAKFLAENEAWAFLDQYTKPKPPLHETPSPASPPAQEPPAVPVEAPPSPPIAGRERPKRKAQSKRKAT
jgi:hypothetical protein